MKTYVISLDNPVTLSAYLRRQRFDPVLIKGVYGKQCPLYMQKKYIDIWFQNWGPKSAIGCAISHIKAWKTFLRSKESQCIIFEDDAIFIKDFAKKFWKIHRYFPQNFDVIYLGCFGSEVSPNFFTASMNVLGMTQNEKPINKYIKIPQVALGAHAYVLSRRGAKKLLRNLYGNVSYHIDYCLQELSVRRKINSYVTTPRLVYQTSSDGKTSYNRSSSFPMLIQRYLSRFYADRKVRADWIASLSIARIGDININIITVCIIIVNVLCSYFLENKFINIVTFLCIIMPDLIQQFSGIESNRGDMLFHIFAFWTSLLIL